MGGTPRLALNLLCFPSCLPLEVAAEILAGGQSKVNEAGAVIAGGHSITDKEPKYGLSVTGFAHPKSILTNKGASIGDVIILTKPIGSGILSTAMKAKMLTPSECIMLVDTMSALNRCAAETAAVFSPHACTDVTGFGLLGHLREIAEGSGVTAQVYADSVPIIPGALAFAREGIVPGGAYRNMEYLKDSVEISGAVKTELSDCLFDPQTSGGLLLSVSESCAGELLSRLKDGGLSAAAVGIVTSKMDKSVIVREGRI